MKVFGKVEDVKVYYHPRSKKHLSIGKVSVREDKHNTELQWTGTKDKAAKFSIFPLINLGKIIIKSQVTPIIFRAPMLG